MCCSPYIVKIITSRRMRWMGHVTHMRNVYKILVGILQEKRPHRRLVHMSRYKDGNVIDV